MNLKTYSVSICRTSYAFTTVDVQASSPEDAENQASQLAGDLEYTSNNAECTVEGVTEKKD